MDTLLQDLRYGLRLLFKNPGFTFVATITLALGIGANSAIFSVANALLLKPFPFENLDRLVMIRETVPRQGMKAVAVSPADFHDWQAQNQVFQEMAAYRVRDITITGQGDPELVRGAFVSAGFFPALELKPHLGRPLLAAEDQPGRDQVVVIGYGLWQRRYAGAQDILGKTIILNDRAMEVVGILPPQIDYPLGTEVWMPLAFTPEQKNQRDTRNTYALALLKPGVSVRQAQAEMRTIAQRIERLYPQVNTGVSVSVILLRDQQREFTFPMLSVLFGMAGFLLLIACANVANLLYARATARQKEVTMRIALGASRWRLARQLITESLVLSAVAGLLGLLLSFWSVELIRSSLPPDIAKHMVGWKEIQVDGSVLLFNFGVAFITTLIFSLAPALDTFRFDINTSLKDTGTTAGFGKARTRMLLVVVEMALAVVLLAGAGLMAKGFWGILSLYRGVNPGRILTLETPLPEAKYKDTSRVVDFYSRSLQKIQGMPEVKSACVTSNTPLNNRPNPTFQLVIEGRPPLQPGERQGADWMAISSDYPRMIGAPLQQGRHFAESDGPDTTPVVLINDAAARAYWPKGDALGARIRRDSADPGQPWLTVVGIVSDVKQSWFDREIRPQLYFSYRQFPRTTMFYLLETETDPMSLVPAARAHILAVDPNQPVDDIKTLAQLFKDEISPIRFAAVLMLVFGIIALVLSAGGIYGVMSFVVARRTNEIGIRSALGAKRGDVLRLILGQGMRTAGIGLLLGAPLSVVLGRLMASMLFGVVALEYTTLTGLLSLLAIVAFLSTYVPANRAARLEPMSALRYE